MRVWRGSYKVQLGSHSSASACWKAGPSSNLWSAPQSGSHQEGARQIVTQALNVNSINIKINKRRVAEHAFIKKNICKEFPYGEQEQFGWNNLWSQAVTSSFMIGLLIAHTQVQYKCFWGDHNINNIIYQRECRTRLDMPYSDLAWSCWDKFKDRRWKIEFKTPSFFFHSKFSQRCCKRWPAFACNMQRAACNSNKNLFVKQKNSSTNFTND